MITVIDSKLFFNILLNIYIDFYTEEDKNYPPEIMCLRAQRHLLTKKKKAVTKTIRLA